MFEKFARRCSRRHKQTTFSDADFLGALRVDYLELFKYFVIKRRRVFLNVIDRFSGMQLFYYIV